MPNSSSLRDQYCIRGRRVLTPNGSIAASIHVRDGVIANISHLNDSSGGSAVYDAGEFVVMPGLVDTHVHINEPGRAEWEGFWNATQAAAAGGVTTLIDMPLNSVPATTTADAYREKMAATAGELWVDVGFWGGIVPGNGHELHRMWKAGVCGFKCFLVATGVPEFQHVTTADLRVALPELSGVGAPLLVHAELQGPIDGALKGPAMQNRPSKYSTWLASRPREAEDEAISLLLRMSAEFRQRIHVVHLSSSNAISILQSAKSTTLPDFTVETCPHYLTFASEEITDGATEFKCAPPIRERENREKLWAALGDGTISIIASDHSPCPPEMKVPETGNFMEAWGGISSIQVSLSAVWTEARLRGYDLTHVIRWMCENPARLAGLQKRKGQIAVGCDADLVIFDPDTKFRVNAETLHHRHKLTPYAGRELDGVVQATFVRGQKVFERGEFAEVPAGRVLRRDQV